MHETALVVLIPQAEPLVAAHRQLGDASIGAPIPAHVTVLFPFRSVIDDDDVAVIGEHASKTPAFEVTFARSGRFPGEVVFLVPEPAQPFRALTMALVGAFPDCPPYNGAHDDVVPHLTVADGLDHATATSLEADLVAAPPIVAPVTHLTLMHHDGESAWRASHAWPLGLASVDPV